MLIIQKFGANSSFWPLQFFTCCFLRKSKPKTWNSNQKKKNLLTFKHKSLHVLELAWTQQCNLAASIPVLSIGLLGTTLGELDKKHCHMGSWKKISHSYYYHHYFYYYWFISVCFTIYYKYYCISICLLWDVFKII